MHLSCIKKASSNNDNNNNKTNSNNDTKNIFCLKPTSWQQLSETTLMDNPISANLANLFDWKIIYNFWAV